jgi:phosphate starvation-inducible protein PhoH and related proteins
MKTKLSADQSGLLQIFGAHYQRKKELEERLEVGIMIRGDLVTLESRSKRRLKKARDFLAALLSETENGAGLPFPEEIVKGEMPSPAAGFGGERAGRLVTAGRRANICVRTRGQAVLYNAVRDNDLVFVVGPAGTGKTYLTVAMAIESLRTRQAERIILARPAVEAGESLGFLPGNLKEKVDPYLAPLYDALYDILPREVVAQYFENKIIEVSPLAYMRGRTLHNAFIILDEAQNATLAQLKMFLTRMGTGSRAVVAGDITQIDLSPRQSGLLSMEGILRGIPGIAFVTLNSSDVLRHRLVRDIIDAYAAYERNNGQK